MRHFNGTKKEFGRVDTFTVLEALRDQGKRSIAEDVWRTTYIRYAHAEYSFVRIRRFLYEEGSEARRQYLYKIVNGLCRERTYEA